MDKQPSKDELNQELQKYLLKYATKLNKPDALVKEMYTEDVIMVLPSAATPTFGQEELEPRIDELSNMFPDDMKLLQKAYQQHDIDGAGDYVFETFTVDNVESACRHAGVTIFKRGKDGLKAFREVVAKFPLKE